MTTRTSGTSCSWARTSSMIACWDRCLSGRGTSCTKMSTSFMSVPCSVATEQGTLMNEGDIFVQLVPRPERHLSQQAIMEEVRAQLQEVPDVRVVMRDQSTEGFTAQRGDPVDFA